jgi:hypothetical protein
VKTVVIVTVYVPEEATIDTEPPTLTIGREPPEFVILKVVEMSVALKVFNVPEDPAPYTTVLPVAPVEG